MERRKPLSPMSARRRAELAEQGRTVWSTLARVPFSPARDTGLQAQRDRKPARDTGPTAAVRRVIGARSGGVCEFSRPCPNLAAHTHHRRPRRMGGSSDPATNMPSNLLRLCADHHEWTESNRAEALRLGLLLHANQDPVMVPVLHAVRGWVLLGVDGSLVPARRVVAP